MGKVVIKMMGGVYRDGYMDAYKDIKKKLKKEMNALDWYFKEDGGLGADEYVRQSWNTIKEELEYEEN